MSASSFAVNGVSGTYCCHVNMSRAGDVVSRELGQELGNTLRAGFHDATEESLIVRCAVVALGPAIEKLGRLRVYTSEASV